MMEAQLEQHPPKKIPLLMILCLAHVKFERNKAVFPNPFDLNVVGQFIGK